MIKNKLDYKLINIALLVLIIFLMYQTSNLWVGILFKILSIAAPFFFAFIIAYALNPCVRFLQKKGLPKWASILLVITVVIVIFTLIIVIAGPLLFNQLSSLFSGIMSFFKELSTNYALDFGDLQTSLNDIFADILKNLGSFVSDGAVNFIGVSLGLISTILVSVSAAVYFLIDMDKFRAMTKTFLSRKSQKMFKYARLLDNEMKLYLTGFLKIICINFFLYTFVFLLTGHPNALLLGFLASIASLIPYFGGIFTNIIALITAFVISPALFVKVLIAVVALSVLDGNVISPLIYGKTNKIPPVLIILAIFAGGSLFGVVGIVLALPLSIVMITTFKYFREDISDKIDEIAEEKKKKNNWLYFSLILKNFLIGSFLHNNYKTTF